MLQKGIEWITRSLPLIVLVLIVMLWDEKGKSSIYYNEMIRYRDRSEMLQGGKTVQHSEAGKCPTCGECVPCSPCLVVASDTPNCNALVEQAKKKAMRIPFYGKQLLCKERGYCNYTLSSTSATSLLDINDVRISYLYTLRHSLTGVLLGTDRYEPDVGRSLIRKEFSVQSRLTGKDWPTFGVTMTGVKRMETLDMLLRKAYIEKKLNGSFMETGVWRGGSCIYASAFLHAYESDIAKDVQVFVYDSFAGLPKKEHPGDARFWAYMNYIAVSEEQVRDYYARYGMLGSNVHFVQGWFEDTVPKHSTKLSILRLDGDMYKSTLEVLCHAYQYLIVGGYWIIDDWNVPAATTAVSHFTGNHSIKDVPQPIEGTEIDDSNNVAVWFEKLADVPISKAWCAAELGRKWNGK